MRALLAASLACLSLFAAHVAVWRLRRPVSQYATLALLSLGVLVCWLAALALARAAEARVAAILPVTALDLTNFIVLYLALVPAYVTTFSAVQADSPTMVVLLLVEAAGARGLSRAEVLDRVGDDVLVAPRLQDLVDSGLARREGGRYVIEPRGALLAAAHSAYRRLLRMEPGG
jgi:hypothetical protein